MHAFVSVKNLATIMPIAHTNCEVGDEYKALSSISSRWRMQVCTPISCLQLNCILILKQAPVQSHNFTWNNCRPIRSSRSWILRSSSRRRFNSSLIYRKARSQNEITEFRVMVPNIMALKEQMQRETRPHGTSARLWLRPSLLALVAKLVTANTRDVIAAVLQRHESAALNALFPTLAGGQYCQLIF